jgi:patatin-like phospholipase
MRVKRILSIDGGGLKGTFPASFLAEVEEAIGEPIADYFDLIVGTSTGGIIAIGLGLGLSAAAIRDFYVEHGPAIFAGNRSMRALRQLGRSKYSSGPLEQALREVFGDHRLGDSHTRLVIPSLNLETGEVNVYKTAHHERFVMDYKVLATHVALATAAAPTYFPTYRSAAGTPLIDGGMWANNPAGIAAVEALGVLGWEPGDVQMLSLGCTTEPLRAHAGRKARLGVNYWALKLVPVMMAGQSSGSFGMAQLLLGHENVLRYSVTVPNRRFKLDSVKDIEALRGLGYSEARKALPRLRSLLRDKAEPFEPYRKPGAADVGDIPQGRQV